MAKTAELQQDGTVKVVTTDSKEEFFTKDELLAQKATAEYRVAREQKVLDEVDSQLELFK